MSEQLTPREANIEAQQSYDYHKEDVANQAKEQQELVEAQAVSKAELVEEIRLSELGRSGQPRPADFGYLRKENAIRSEEADQQVKEKAGKLALTEVQNSVNLDEYASKYKANNGAYQDAAVAEAMLDGVHINVQQPTETAQQVPVQVIEHNEPQQ